MKYGLINKKNFIRAIIAAILVIASISIYAIYRDQVILEQFLSPPTADIDQHNVESRIEKFLDKYGYSNDKRHGRESNCLLDVGSYVGAYHRKYPNALIGESTWLVEDIHTYLRNNIPNFDNEWSIYAQHHSISIQPNPPKGRRIGTIIIIEPEFTKITLLDRIRRFFFRIFSKFKK